MKTETERKIIGIFLFAGIIVSIIFGRFAIENGKPYLKSKYDRLKPIDRGNINGVDLSCADKETLMKIDGIGEEYSKRIIETREDMGGFKSVYDITEAEGIGEKRAETVKKYVKIK